MKKIKFIILAFVLFIAEGCSEKFNNIDPTGNIFPSVKGKSLKEKKINIPEDFFGSKTLFLIGYVRNSQFDIDRWTIAIDQKNLKVNTFEIPVIQGVLPKFFSKQIDNGMRSGIPNDIWNAVVTVYKDSRKIQKFTGNEKPRNSRIILIDEKGIVIFFYDKGFSVGAINKLQNILEKD